MSSYLCITIRFLSPDFHGRQGGGDPEWPPSPHRLFQAIVSSAARQWPREEFQRVAAPFLVWLEKQTAPLIVGPSATRSEGYRLYVPDNVGDLVGRSWSNGGDSSIAEFRTEKNIRPLRLATGPVETSEIHYLWNLDKASCSNDVLQPLHAAVRSITHLGWGVDMVVAHSQVISEDDASNISGHRWSPTPGGSSALRVPKPGTLDDLCAKHERFLSRLAGEVFTPVPPLKVFDTVSYHSPTANDAIERPMAAFSFLNLDASGFRAFSMSRDHSFLFGMLRGLTKRAALLAGWSHEDCNRFIMGHDEAPGDAHRPVGNNRLAFLPIPSLEYRGGKALNVGNIRRLIITSYSDEASSKIAWTRRALAGSELQEDKKENIVGLLSLLPTSDRSLSRFIRPATTWATVTPVVLPGFTDGNPHKIEKLIRKAIVQAGISEVLAKYASVEWRATSWWPGADLASRYQTAAYLRNFPKYHVRLEWQNPQGIPIVARGPLCIGSGKFQGLGLFASLDL